MERVENRICRNTFPAIDFINFLMDFTFSAVEDFNISDKYLCVGLGWVGGWIGWVAIRIYMETDLEPYLLLSMSATGLSGLCPFFLWTGIDYDWQMALGGRKFCLCL